MGKKLTESAKLGHTVKTQFHIRTCEVCDKTGQHVIVVQLLYAIRKASGAMGQGRVRVNRCPKCLGG